MSKKTLSIKDSCLSFVSAFILAQLAVVLFVLVLSVFFNFLKLDISVEVFTNTAIGYLICTIILNLTLLFVFLYFQKNSTNNIHKKPTLKKLCLYTTIGVLAFFALSPIVTCVNTLLFNLNFKQNTIPYSLSTGNYVISIFSLALLPAVFEELLFRGLIFKGLKPHGKAFSIIISAIMFCLFHVSIEQTVYPILMGLLMGVIMFYENNIIYTITIHFISNFLAITLQYFNINLVFQHWTFILLAIVLVVIFLSVVIYYILKNRKQEEHKPVNRSEKLYITISLIGLFIIWIANSLSLLL